MLDQPYAIYLPPSKKNSTPVHEEQKLWITFIAKYLYEVGGNPTPCDDFHVLLFTILINSLQVLPNTFCIL